jgi:hypothetical protein
MGSGSLSNNIINFFGRDAGLIAWPGQVITGVFWQTGGTWDVLARQVNRPSTSEVAGNVVTLAWELFFP